MSEHAGEYERSDWATQYARVKMLLAEAGYPSAPVEWDDDLGIGITTAGIINGEHVVWVPEDVADRALVLAGVKEHSGRSES